MFDGLVLKLVGRKSAPALHSTNRSASISLPFPFPSFPPLSSTILPTATNKQTNTHTHLGQSSSTRFEASKTAPRLPLPPSKLLSRLA